MALGDSTLGDRALGDSAPAGGTSVTLGSASWAGAVHAPSVTGDTTKALGSVATTLAVHAPTAAVETDTALPSVALTAAAHAPTIRGDVTKLLPSVALTAVVHAPIEDTPGNPTVVLPSVGWSGIVHIPVAVDDSTGAPLPGIFLLRDRAGYPVVVPFGSAAAVTGALRDFSGSPASLFTPAVPAPYTFDQLRSLAGAPNR